MEWRYDDNTVSFCWIPCTSASHSYLLMSIFIIEADLIHFNCFTTHGPGCTLSIKTWAPAHPHQKVKRQDSRESGATAKLLTVLFKRQLIQREAQNTLHNTLHEFDYLRLGACTQWVHAPRRSVHSVGDRVFKQSNYRSVQVRWAFFFLLHFFLPYSILIVQDLEFSGD